MSLGRYSRSIRIALKRVGQEAKIIREGDTTPNGYGKVDGRWDDPVYVGSWRAWRSYSYRSDRPQQEHTGAGERDEDTPVFFLPDNADIQNGDRIVYDGTEYEVTSDPVSYQTHYECRTTKVDGQ